MIARLAASGNDRGTDEWLVLASSTLTGLSILFLTLGLATADLDLSQFGLIPSFSIVFLIGLVMLPLASSCLWFIDRRLDGVIAGQLVLLIAALWLSPYVLESTVRFRSGYKNFAAVDWLLRGNWFDAQDVVYHNWPLFPSVMAGVAKMLPVSSEALMGLFPFAASIAYIVPLVVLLRIFHPSGNRWWAGIWFFYLFNWTGQDYFSPQAFALLLYLCLLALLAYISARRDGEFDVGSTALVLVLYGAIVLTHLLTALIAFATLGALMLARRLKHWPLLAAAAAMLLSWQMYGAFEYFDTSHNRLLDSLLSPQDFFNLNVGGRLAGTPEHTVVGRLRMLATVLAFALAGLGFWVWTRDHGLHRRDGVPYVRGLRGAFRPLEQGDGDQHLTPLAVVFAVVSLLGLLVLAPMYAYGGEMLIRVLLFSLPALAILVVIAVQWRPAAMLVVALFAVMAPLHIVVHYGNESYDYVSPKEIDGFRFVIEELGPANIYGGYPAGAWQNTKTLDWRYSVRPGKKEKPDIQGYLSPEQFRWRHDDWPIFVALSRGDGAAAHLFYNEPTFLEDARRAIERRCNFELVFGNEDFTLYRWRPSCNARPDEVTSR